MGRATAYNRITTKTTQSVNAIIRQDPSKNDWKNTHKSAASVHQDPHFCSQSDGITSSHGQESARNLCKNISQKPWLLLKAILIKRCKIFNQQRLMKNNILMHSTQMFPIKK